MSSPEFPEDVYRMFDQPVENELPAEAVTHFQSATDRQTVQSNAMHPLAGSSPGLLERCPSPPAAFAADFFDSIDASNSIAHAPPPVANHMETSPKTGFAGLTAGDLHFVPPAEAHTTAGSLHNSPDIMDAFFGSHNPDD